MTRNKAVLPIIGLAALFALSACGGNDSAQNTTTTQAPAATGSAAPTTAMAAPETTAAPPQGEASTEPAGGSATTAEAQGTARAGAGTAGGQSTSSTAAADKQCSGQTGRQAAEANVGKVPDLGSTYYNAHWIVPNTDLSKFDDCAALGAIPVTINAGTVSSPWQIMLFSHGRYLGTATEHAYGWDPAITRLPDNSIQVTYSYAQGNDANAAPSGKATSVFTIDGSGHVTRTGELPPR